jgi:hypothetical protein
VKQSVAELRDGAAHDAGVFLGRGIEPVAVAIFGTSLAMWICIKSPAGVKITMPRGVGPKG